jgi:hypothetical protein
MARPNGVYEIVSGKNDQGEQIFSVVVKRTYMVKNGCIAVRRETDHELRIMDEYFENGDPEWATIRYEYEMAPFKPFADVVVIGKAYAPGGAAVSQMTATVKVADREKNVVIFGDRKCQYRDGSPPVFSDPEPFMEMEIRFERAYGGSDDTSIPDIPFFYPRNPLGTGIALRNTKEVIEGLVLPNIEDPNDLLAPERIVIEDPRLWHNQPLPQGFGWFQRNWYPRCSFAGSYPPFIEVDVVTKEESMGLLPKNHVALAKQFRLPAFDSRFNNGASQGMMFPYLKGDETISLQGMTPDGFLEFSLPGETPVVLIDIGQGEQQLQAALDTVCIRTDELEIDLVWRAVHVYEGYAWLPKMKRLQVEVR